eukprot:354526-Chlamydomonas_euryale.AAC.3
MAQGAAAAGTRTESRPADAPPSGARRLAGGAGAGGRDARMEPCCTARHLTDRTCRQARSHRHAASRCLVASAIPNDDFLPAVDSHTSPSPPPPTHKKTTTATTQLPGQRVGISGVDGIVRGQAWQMARRWLRD